MAKKFEWTREVEDVLRKANFSDGQIAEFKHKDVEKLPLELLDGYSGGGTSGPGEIQAPGDWQNPFYNNVTMIDAQLMVQEIERNFGTDICIDFCNDTFWPSYDWERWIRQGGGAYAVDMMWSVCYKLWLKHN